MNLGIPELIVRENIPWVWGHIFPRVERAFEKAQFAERTIEQTYALLLEEKAQLWISQDGEMIGITRIVNYPGVKRLVIDLMEGANPQDYKEDLEYIEHWAISLGATEAEAEIRPGFLKIVKSFGWKKRRIKVFKDLKRGLH